MKRELCDTAKKGKRCIDDLCRGADLTLCGFDEDLWDDISGDDEDRFRQEDSDEIDRVKQPSGL